MKTDSSFDLRAVSQEFSIGGAFLESRPHGNGHINDTFVAAFDQSGIRVRVIFQRINQRIFKKSGSAHGQCVPGHQGGSREIG